ETLQAALAGNRHAAPAGILRIDLADDKDLIAPPLDGFGHDFLGTALAIHLRRVDQAEAEIESEPKRCGLALAVATPLAHPPGTLTQRHHRLARRQRYRPQGSHHQILPAAIRRSIDGSVQPAKFFERWVSRPPSSVRSTWVSPIS